MPTCDALMNKMAQDFDRFQRVDVFVEVRVVGFRLFNNHTELFRNGELVNGRTISHRGVIGADTLDLSRDLNFSSSGLRFSCDSHRFLVAQEGRLVFEVDTPLMQDIKRWRFEWLWLEDDFYLWKVSASIAPADVILPVGGRFTMRFQDWAF